MSAKLPKRRRTRASERESQPLNEHDILEAALRLIRRDGGEKLSMRTLACDLGVTPMAIYHYVPSKAALVQKLGDSVMGDAATPVPSGTHWARELRTYALEIWERLSAHPGLTDLLLKQPPSAVQRKRTRYAASILVAGGFDERSAGLTIMSFQMFMFGVMSTHARVSKVAKPTTRSSKAQRSDRLLEYLSSVDFRIFVEHGIDTIIAGTRAQMLERSAGDGAASMPAPRRARVDRLEGLDAPARGRAPRSS